jgi:hypothetical protein
MIHDDDDNDTPGTWQLNPVRIILCIRKPRTKFIKVPGTLFINDPHKSSEVREGTY